MSMRFERPTSAVSPEAAAEEPAPARAFTLPPGLREHYLGPTIFRKATASLDDAPEPEDAFARAAQGPPAEIPYRGDMEHSFGEDFSGVAAYLGRASETAALGAEAATRGERVAFAASAPGRELVAHELTHVVQARHGGADATRGKRVSSPDEAAEVEADRVAAQAAAGQRVTVGHGAPAPIALKGNAELGWGRFKIKGDEIVRAEDGTSGWKVEVLTESPRSQEEVRVKVREPAGHKGEYRVNRSLIKWSSYQEEAPQVQQGPRGEAVTKRSAQLRKPDGSTVSTEAPAEIYFVDDPSSKAKSEDFEVRIFDMGGLLEGSYHVGGGEIEWSSFINRKLAQTNVDGLADHNRFIKKGSKYSEYRASVDEANTNADTLTIVFDVTTPHELDRLEMYFEAVAGQQSLAFDVPVPNPAWRDRKRSDWMGSRSAEGRVSFPATHGGKPDTHRVFSLRVPTHALHEFFAKCRGRPWQTSDILRTKLSLWYANVDKGVSEPGCVCNGAEFEKAFNGLPQAMHWQGGDKGGSGDISYAHVAKRLGITKIDVTDSQIFSFPLLPGAKPSYEKEFPRGYAKQQRSVLPLMPKSVRPEQLPNSDFKLSSRIENEATVHVSSRQNLHALIGCLHRLCMPNSPELEKIMQMAEESDYHWTLKPLTDLYLAGGVPEPQLYDKEKHRGYEVDHELMEAARHQFPEDEAFAGHLADQPIGRVEHFTDTYMDLQGGSPLLDEGVSVRKRSTMKGTKLNVKTGPGKPISDVTFRRHELGMHMRPGATAPQIGRYLEAGHARAGDGEVIDPWNRMAFEAERAARFGEGELDFAKLREVLVLQGKRHKFALSGTPGPGCAGTPINIEISCDHTVGQLAADFDPKAAAGWNSDSQKLKHIFNIEMELEHLPFNGGGETAAPAMPEEEPQGKGKEKEKEKESGGAPPAEATDDERPVPPPGHPGRYYLNADTDSAAWKTPAFERFEHIHGAVLGYLREQIKGDKKELGPDEQKVTNLFDALGKPQAK